MEPISKIVITGDCSALWERLERWG